jgi:hypothetical protein
VHSNHSDVSAFAKKPSHLRQSLHSWGQSIFGEAQFPQFSVLYWDSGYRTELEVIKIFIYSCYFGGGKCTRSAWWRTTTCARLKPCRGSRKGPRGTILPFPKPETTFTITMSMSLAIDKCCKIDKKTICFQSSWPTDTQQHAKAIISCYHTPHFGNYFCIDKDDLTFYQAFTSVTWRRRN